MTTQTTARSHPTSHAPGSRIVDSSESWHSAHIYYYEPDKDALILDAIRPLLHQLRPVVQAAYLVRHWRQGPHLRLHLRTDPHTWATTVQPQIDHTIGTYLRTHPSTATLDEHAELPTHLLLAEREQENGPLTPWYPDNSIHYLPYDPRLHVLGHQQVADLFTDYLTDSTEPLFAMLEHIRNGADTKELLSLSLMLATSHTLAPPITRSFMSYRSHAEIFLSQSTDPAATKAAFNQHYHTHRDALTNRVQAVLDTLNDPSTGEPVPFVRGWATLLQTYADRAKPLIQAGLLFPPTPILPPTGPRGSAFLQTLLANRTYQELIANKPPFNRNRFGLNCTYLQISRLGLAPFQRMRTCHVAAKAIEDIYGISAEDIVKTFVERHPNQPVR